MERAIAKEFGDAFIIKGSGIGENCHAYGRYVAECFDKDGNLKWSDTIENVVTQVGKNNMLQAALSGVSYSVTGPYMGLISSDTYSAVSATDTMASHTGWREAGATYAPFYTAPRKTAVWSPAVSGSMALSSALSFTIITTGGTVKGCFMVYGTGAASTIDDTNGVLYSAGLFTGGDKVVGVGDTLQVSYTTGL